MRPYGEVISGRASGNRLAARKISDRCRRNHPVGVPPRVRHTIQRARARNERRRAQLEVREELRRYLVPEPPTPEEAAEAVYEMQLIEDMMMLAYEAEYEEELRREEELEARRLFPVADGYPDFDDHDDNYYVTYEYGP